MQETSMMLIRPGDFGRTSDMQPNRDRKSDADSNEKHEHLCLVKADQ
jgi:hypothetical protein